MASRAVAESWDGLVEEFVTDTFRARPHVAVGAGRHEHDGRLPDWSRSGLRAERRRLRDVRERARGYGDAGMSEPRRLERLYLLSAVEGDLFWLERARWPERNPFFYLEGLSPRVYVTRPYAEPEVRMEALAAHARGVPAAVAQARDNLTEPLPAPSVEVARTAFSGLATYFGDEAQRAFGEAGDRELRRELRAALDSAATAVRGLTGWLGEVETAPAGASLLGAGLLREMLWATERVDVPLSRLEEAAEAALERNLSALERACRGVDAGASTEAAVRRVRDERPADSLLAEARRQVPRLRREVRDHGLASVPEAADARVEPSPPFLRWNPAMIDIPGPGDEDVPAVFYITPEGVDGEDGEGAPAFSRPELLYVAAHEVWPGHYLHFLHARRSSSLLARHFVGTAFAEGWAHYAEQLCWETGLAGDDPVSEAAMRLSALLRNVRFLAAVGLHGGALSLADAEALFREKAFLRPDAARQQAARGVFDPEYLGYTMGKLMISKLRRDWCGARGGRSAWSEFHDRLLGLGAPPVPVARRALLGGDDAGELL